MAFGSGGDPTKTLQIMVKETKGYRRKDQETLCTCYDSDGRTN